MPGCGTTRCPSWSARDGPESDVAVHRQTSNRRHHFEKLSDWPPGLLVVGDALCALNPVYGQGITVAAVEALLLRQFSKVTALPWAIATGEDQRYPAAASRASPGQALMGRWSRELGLLAAHGDLLAQETLARVYHLMAPPWLLFRPGVVAAAVRARLHGYGPPNARPQILLSESPREDGGGAR